MAKRAPSSAKKHKYLRRNRHTNWDRSREERDLRDKAADIMADQYIKELLNDK